MKQRVKALGIVLLLASIATSLFFTPWEVRWRILSYIPIFLFSVHIGIFFAALSKPKYWPAFIAYFVVPIILYLGFVFWIFSATKKDTSGWGGMFLPGAIISIPILPFQLPEIVENKIERKQDGERYLAVNSGSLSVAELLEKNKELSIGEQRGIYLRLHREENFSESELRKLILNYRWHRQSPEAEIIRLALSHPNASEDTLVEFYEKNKGSNHCTAIAKNPKTPLWVLEEMAVSENDYVRLAAVDSGRLSDRLIIEALRLTLNSRWIHGRRFVADSEHATHQMLQALMKDDEYILEGIAANPKAPYEILEELAGHQSSKVRSAIITNESSTEGIIAIATSVDTDWRIEKALKERQKSGSEGH
jgi:hypothetical protein